MHIRDINDFDTFKALFDEGGYNEKDSWVVGGLTGGNCWGGEADMPVTADEEPDGDLDEFLTLICPDLTFMQYRRLMKSDVLEYETKSQSEYYGNYTDYRYRTINLDKLYQALKDIYD